MRALEAAVKVAEAAEVVTVAEAAEAGTALTAVEMAEEMKRRGVCRRSTQTEQGGFPCSRL